MVSGSKVPGNKEYDFWWGLMISWCYHSFFFLVLGALVNVLCFFIDRFCRVSDWNKSSEFTLLTFTTFVPRPKKVKKFFWKFSDTVLIPPGPLKFAAI